MVIDTSALAAIFENEPERRTFIEAIAADSVRLISAATVLEAGILLEGRRGEHAGRELDLFLHRANVQIVPADDAQVEVARAAYRRYGKGRHTEGLNFGDCFSYALAKVRGQPLLAKGDGFRHTDAAIVGEAFPRFAVPSNAPPISLERTLEAEEGETQVGTSE